MKLSFWSILLILVTLNLSRSEAQPYKSIPDSIRFLKITQELQRWNIVAAINELKEISTTQKPSDEAYFYFFKASIVFNTWKQTDSIRENTSLTFIDTAVKYYERALSIDKTIFFNQLYIKSPQIGLDTCASILGQYAKMYFLKQDYLKALSYYEKIIDFKSDPMYLTAAGLTALQLTSYPKAIQYLDQSLQLNPKSEKSWLALIEVYKRQNDTINALETANKALIFDSLNLNFLINYVKLATVYKPEKVISAIIDKLEKFSPKNDLIYITLGNYYLAYKQFDKAELNFLLYAKKTNPSVMLKFYYNWYLDLYISDLLMYKANLIDYSASRIRAMIFIQQKIQPYLANSNSQDAEIVQVLDFFKKEFNYLY